MAHWGCAHEVGATLGPLGLANSSGLVLARLICFIARRSIASSTSVCLDGSLRGVRSVALWGRAREVGAALQPPRLAGSLL